jgi:Activator of mitotic machinery Cdc14 phosphatase activation C-term
MAPSHHDGEDDPSRLFWVPARLHPELAPKEFKTFINDRVKTVKRSSLSEDNALAPEPGTGSLRRRKSMLSRQIDNGNGYEDGAERLLRKRSQSGQSGQQEMNLEELESLVSDPSNIAQRMSMDRASRASMESGSEGAMSEDMPILPAKPAGQTLKRSTRTQYRRGSLKKGGLLSRRQTLKGDQDDESSPASSDAPQLPYVPTLPDLSDFSTGHFGLTRVQTDPLPSSSKPVENFSRPGRRGPLTPPMQSSPSFEFEEAPAVQNPDANQLPRPQSHDESSSHKQQFQSRFASNGRTTAKYNQPIPQIIEPQSSDQHSPITSPERPQSLPVQPPERSSSMEHPTPPQGPLQSRPLHQRPPLIRPQSLPHQVPPRGNSHKPSNITLDDITASPSMIPGNSNRTEALSIIPTYADEGKRGDKKSKGKDDGSRKTSWGWFSSSNNEEKKEREEKDAKKNKSRLQRPGAEKQDNTRLDVLQTSIDGRQSRESAVFDRQSLHLEDDSRKPARKTSAEVKKDSGLFSSLFGSSKKKAGEKDGAGGKKSSSLRGLSPDPPPRIIRPDVDYNWSRFSILEERAIYRMAHIKLANPRRELYSQVLLSNFMYSYLAKVQQMHPQIQIPQSAAQKQAQRQERQQQKKQEAERQQALQQQQTQQPQQNGLEEFSQYQRYQEV